jgi:UDP-glucose 4-epimerase
MTTTPRILVLGAAGFIGRQLSERLASRGADVIAATRHPARFQHPGIRNVVASLDDASHFLPLLAHSTAVIHAASASTPGSSAAQPQLDGNLRTTLALVEALQLEPSCRLLFLSSGGTLYGNRDTPATENDPLRPRSYHGAGKAAAEHFIHAWSAQYEGTAVLLRPSNVYGPGQRARAGFAIVPTALECAQRNTPLTLWGDGQAIRDYLYIDDLLTLCEATLAAPLASGSHVFNASSEGGITLHALLDAIDQVTGLPLQRLHRPARRVDIERIVADSGSAQRAFGWQPAVPLQDGLHRTWQWFRTQA